MDTSKCQQALDDSYGFTHWELLTGRNFDWGITTVHISEDGQMMTMTYKDRDVSIYDRVR
jgi:hypothetical protein